MLTACTPRTAVLSPTPRHGPASISFKHKWGCIYKEQEVWAYRHRKIDPRPFPDPPINDLLRAAAVVECHPIQGRLCREESAASGDIRIETLRQQDCGSRASSSRTSWSSISRMLNASSFWIACSTAPTRYVKFGFPSTHEAARRSETISATFTDSIISAPLLSTRPADSATRTKLALSRPSQTRKSQL